MNKTLQSILRSITDRRGMGFLLTPQFLLILLLIGGIYAIGSGRLKLPFLSIGDRDQDAGSTPGAASLTGSACQQERDGCNVEDVTIRWNDLNALAAATDPGTALWLDVRSATVADDGTTTMGVGVETDVIYGDASATYFREVGTFCAVCSGDVDIKHSLYAGGAPTITVIGTNGATVLSAGTEEAVGASGQPTFTIKVRAGADTCAAGALGALAVLHYDRDVWSRIDSSLPASPYVFSSLPDNAVFAPTDAQAAFLWQSDSVKLCDNKQIEFTVSPLADSDDADMTGNLTLEWFPVQYFRNTENNAVQKGIQNNAGTLQRSGANTTAEIPVS